MDVKYKSIRIVDFENEKVYEREIPDSFNEYIVELITHVKNNESVREYKSISNKTEVIGSIIEVIEKDDDIDEFESKSNIIARRLLRTEMEAQKKVDQMRVNVKKGSLIQALIQDDETKEYSYLLAKVEHSNFVDDEDFTFKTGFSKDKKTIWKSCLIDMSDVEAEIFEAKVYSDTGAKYWSNSFLELEEMISDESNTVNAFKSINQVLNRTVKNYSMMDYTYIRNSVIVYFRTHNHFDYYSMLDDLIDKYIPEELSDEQYKTVVNRLKELPEKKKFDVQFNTVAKVLTVKIKKCYKVNNAVDIVLKDGIEDLDNMINSFQNEEGTKYIMIKTEEEGTFKSFKIKKEIL